MQRSSCLFSIFLQHSVGLLSKRFFPCWVQGVAVFPRAEDQEHGGFLYWMPRQVTVEALVRGKNRCYRPPFIGAI